MHCQSLDQLNLPQHIIDIIVEYLLNQISYSNRQPVQIKKTNEKIILHFPKIRD